MAAHSSRNGAYTHFGSRDQSAIQGRRGTLCAASMASFLLSGLAAVNLWTFLCFWQDKARAAAGGHRVPERDLLMLALIGGSPAAFAARSLFRHKTRKQPFSFRLKAIAGGQLILAIAYWAYQGSS